jgi:uncharacterized membrane protein YdfJ with MMPL/SSD domain
VTSLLPPARAAGRVFPSLARWVVRHPLVPIVVWVTLLLVTLPFLSHLGSVTTNSTSTLPSNAPSSLADKRFGELFPNDSSPASTTLVFYGSGATGRVGQGVIENVTAAVVADRSLLDVRSVGSVYTAYSAYLAGEAELTGGAIAAAEGQTPSVPNAVNTSSTLLWHPVALFLGTWESLTHNTTGGTAWTSNYPAYHQTATTLNGSTGEQAVLAAFYNGSGGSGPGFNGTPSCANRSSVAGAIGCADNVTRANVRPLLPTLVPSVDVPTANATLAGLGSSNATSWPAVRAVASALVAGAAALPGPWINTVWTAFPTGAVSAVEAGTFAAGLVANSTLAAEPLPVPEAIRTAYVNGAGNASLVQVTFSVSDTTTDASGGNVVDTDLAALDALVPPVLRASDPSGAIAYVQTGPSALDELTQETVNASLKLVLPLTVGLLLGISMLYFRSPIAPLVTFAGLGLVLVLALGGTVLLGTLVTHVDSTSLTLEEVFVLGVGTDYSIFLAARYREELARGRSSEEAVVASVTWAGQSVATSGSTAILVTVALTLSGVALLSQWGMVLSLAILLTMLLSLTLVPACLTLLGPRIFWPSVPGRRPGVGAAAGGSRTTYFERAAQRTAKRPIAIVVLLLLVSAPLIAIALTAPVSYNFYDQLPSGHPATTGLARLGEEFGPGFAVPSFALVTFAAPLLAGTTTNASEFGDLAALTGLANHTAGIASVGSPIGPSGASLAEWLALPGLPAPEQAALLGVLSGYVGNNGSTVLLTLVPASAGLSADAVAAVGSVQASFESYAASTPRIASLAFGGGAPSIRDLANQTDAATLAMIVAVTIGLVTVLLVVLRSWIVALMAVATIGLSISWAWAITDLVLQQLAGLPIFFYVRTILFLLVLGLGIDYNIFLLTRVREERVRGRSAREAVREALARTGGIISAAAVILASAFGALLVAEFTLIRAIGFSVAVAVLLDAMVVRTYLVPSALQALGERVWDLRGRRPKAPAAAPSAGPRS